MDILLDWIIGLGLIVIGILLLILQFSRTKKHDNVFGKAVHYQLIVVGFFLIIGGLTYLSRI